VPLKRNFQRKITEGNKKNKVRKYEVEKVLQVNLEKERMKELIS
jgi:hypothetical protein